MPAMPSPSSACAPYPELHSFAPATAARDWAHVYSAYSGLTSNDLRSAAMYEIADIDQAKAMLTPVAQGPGDGPEQLTARTLLAANHIHTGWEIRTGYRASHVSKSQFQQFHAYLRRAERLLIDVVARQPDNVPAWNLRLKTARGLGLGQSEARRRYDHAARYEPHDLAAQQSLLQQLCPKWSGSFEQVHRFASTCAETAPAGSMNAVLIVQAHMEHWSDLPDKERAAYLGSPAVRDQVAAAAHQSVLHPAFRRCYGWVDAHGWFALYHSQVGDLAAAAAHFRAVGEFDLSAPWSSFFGDSEQRFQQHRAAALAKG
jgi:hypothetical protein